MSRITLATLLLALAAPAPQAQGAVTLLQPSDADGYDHFGSDHAFLGDSLLVVGAEWKDRGPECPGCWDGAVYVFRRADEGAGAAWEQEGQLRPAYAYPDQTGYFGFAVAVCAGPGGALYAVGGAPYESAGPFPGPFYYGGAYVHRRDPATQTWALDGRLVPEGVAEFSYTGTAVGLACDGAGVTALAWSAASIVAWRRDDAAGAWAEEQRLPAPFILPDFDAPDRLAVGPPGPIGAAQGPLAAAAAGGDRVRVWRRTGAAPAAPWALEATLTGSEVGPDDDFGAAVAVAGDLVVVGAPYLASGGPPGGAAYVFRYTGAGPLGGWEEEAVLRPAAPRPYFGVQVAAWAGPAGDGAWARVAVRAGSALHTFRRDGGGAWAEEALLLQDEAGFAGVLRDAAGPWAGVGSTGYDEPDTDAGAVFLVDVDRVVASEPPPGPRAPLALTLAPNPARGAVAVTLTLGAPAAVRVAAYDVLGREVARVHDGVLGAGPHRLRLDAGALAPGLYVVRAEGGALVASRAITRVR